MLIIWELFLLFEVKLQDWGWFILQSFLTIPEIMCYVGNLGLLPSALQQGPWLITAGLSWQKVRRLHLTEDGSRWWILRLLNDVKATDFGPFMVLLISLNFTFTDHTTNPSQSFWIFAQLVTEGLNQSKRISSRKQWPEVAVYNSMGSGKCVPVGCLRSYTWQVQECYRPDSPTFPLQIRKQKCKEIKSNPWTIIQVFLILWLLFQPQESNSLGISFDSHKNPMKWGRLYKQADRITRSHINAATGPRVLKLLPRIRLNPWIPKQLDFSA